MLDPEPTQSEPDADPAPTPPPGAAPDWTIPQRWADYTPAEHGVWDLLFARQQKLLAGRAVPEFIEGLDILRLPNRGIPDLDRLSERLRARTGWTVVPVPGLVPDEVFYRHLAARRFPAGSFIRRPEQLDYLEEPDIFHDVFGHVPLLAHPAVADFMQALGELGLAAARAGAMQRVARLYWYTVEFGLARDADGLRIYGAGILSSSGEVRFSLESPYPNRLPFSLERVMRTRYRVDNFQQTYFVIDSLESLLDPAFDPRFDGLDHLDDIEPTELLPGEELLPPSQPPQKPPPGGIMSPPR